MTNTQETGLQLIKAEHFGDIEADIYSDNKDMFMTSAQLADCLGFANGRKGLDNLISRNLYLKTDEYSTTLAMRVVEGTRHITRQMRVFNEDGIYEVSFIADAPKAKEFRKWVRGILKSLRSGELQLSSQGYVLTQEAVESMFEKYVNSKFETMESHLLQKFDTRLNSMENAFTYIQKLLEQNSRPLVIADADWKSKMFKRVDELLRQQPNKYKNSKEILKSIYDKMNCVYGIVWDQEQREFGETHNITGRAKTMELISDKEQLKSLFECILNDMFIYESDKIVITNSTPIKDIINPLILKYNDATKGGNLTYRKVYFAMGVDWHNRQVRYKNKNNRKVLPSKSKLLSEDDKLMNIFKKTVNEMLNTKI